MLYKNNDSILLTCPCGCGLTYNFKYSFSVIYVECLSSVFYAKQDNIKYKIEDKCKKLYKRIRKKPIYLNEIPLQKEEFWSFIDALTGLVEGMSDEENDDTKCCEVDKENSSLVVTKYKFDNSDMLYDVCLKCKQNTKDLLFHEHRAYDTCFTKKQLQKFLNNVNIKFGNDRLTTS